MRLVRVEPSRIFGHFVTVQRRRWWAPWVTYEERFAGWRDVWTSMSTDRRAGLFQERYLQAVALAFDEELSSRGEKTDGT